MALHSEADKFETEGLDWERIPMIHDLTEAASSKGSNSNYFLIRDMLESWCKLKAPLKNSQMPRLQSLTQEVYNPFIRGTVNSFTSMPQEF